ncbi:MAG: Unknown protein [uncultured Sulfurovum sp.]|uniref:Uncharacterized protein n=1 Tax=uncultured Sulfurovum sp. TaxID=269237 RepID=A0A6S6SPV6_9BACT|nr:MAG: Unknown protein [uncultured Sulfurovum sp.]
MRKISILLDKIKILFLIFVFMSIESFAITLTCSSGYTKYDKYKLWTAGKNEDALYHIALGIDGSKEDIIIDKVWTHDGNGDEQSYEQFKFMFTTKNCVEKSYNNGTGTCYPKEVLATTDYTKDVSNTSNDNNEFTDFGKIVLPAAVGYIKLVHRTSPRFGDIRDNSFNSVEFRGFCYKKVPKVEEPPLGDFTCSSGYTKLLKNVQTSGRNDSSNLVTDLFSLSSDIQKIDIEKVWTYDASPHIQDKEQFKLIFMNGRDIPVAQTKYTTDIDNTAENTQFSDLGTVTLPTGEKKITLVHRADSNYGDDLDYYNSVTFKGLCYKTTKGVIALPSINIEVATNASDADKPKGPSIAFGGAVTWTYVVKNTGNVALTTVLVKDNKAGTICTVGNLAAGASKTCTKKTTAVNGQYANIGTVTAKYNGQNVQDTDPTHYLGGDKPAPAIEIEKSTNGSDADSGTGPSIGFGETVTWRYIVKNIGNVALTNISVSDDKIGKICSIDTLAIAKTQTCTKTGKAIEGQYVNIGTVIGEYAGEVVKDSDKSHYLGGEKPKASIEIEKATNGQDADSGTGPMIAFGSKVTWTYVIKNKGNVPLTDIKVIDDKIGTICTAEKLAVKASKTCTKVGIAIEGQYVNIGTVTAKNGDEIVKDSDKSHYLGGKEPEVPNNPPVTNDDTKVGKRCQAVSFNILDNDLDIDQDLNVSSVNLLLIDGWDGVDSDNDGDIDSIIIPDEGKWLVTFDGVLTYTSINDCVTNPATLEYTVRDDLENLSNKSTVTVTYPEILKSSIGDFVWFDADKNGQQNTGEMGLEGIRVELYDGNNELNQTSITDKDGLYRFINLDAGEYSLQFVVKDGYSFSPNKLKDVNKSLDSDADSQTGKTAIFMLLEGEDNNDIDAGMFITSKPNIKIVKTTNGGNINNIIVGDMITWAYVVTNTGNTRLNNIVVTDDKEGVVTECDDDALNPQQSMTCTKTGQAVLGAYSNLGTVEALDSEGKKVSSSSSSSYVGKDAPVILGTIGDYVWLDSNKNGLQDATELALENITVKLFDKNKKLIMSTQTDSTGNYLFKEILRGEYYVEFVVPNGYTVTLKEVGEDRTKDSNANTNGKTSLFTLAEGANDVSIDLGLYPTLTNLGDRVFLDVNSNGIQDADEKLGVPNVRVKLYTENNKFITETKTTSTGQYLFRNLVPRNYYVIFEIPKSYKVSPQNQGANESADSDANSDGKTEIITLIGGQDNKAIDMGLHQEEIKVGDKVFYDSNKNGIQDQGETGVGNVAVSLYNTKKDVPIATTRTTASGIYIFDNVVAGEYYIIFNPPVGYTVTKSGQGAKDIDSNPNSEGRTENFILVAGTQDSTIDMGVYQDVVSYGDKVFIDTNHNGLQDIDEKGVRDVNVTINSANSGFSKSMLTDENGNYLFRNLPAGEYSAEFRSIPYGYIVTEKDVNNNMNDLNDSDGFVENEKILTEVALLIPGKNDLSWDLGIYKTVCLPGKSVIGNLVFEDFNKNGVQDVGERGLANVAVSLFNNDTEEKVENTVTDENGLYEFNHVDPEFNYYVQFTIPNGFVVSPQDQDDDTIDSDADETGKTEVIILEADQINATVDMGLYREGSTLGDRVFFDELNGVSNGIQDEGELGANDIKVTLYSHQGIELNSTRTNVSGEYHFTNVTSGRYIVAFSELPAGYVFTQAKQGNNDEKDSDVNSDGRSEIIFVNGKVNITGIDAGLKKVNTGVSTNDIKRGLTGQNVTLDILANDMEGTFNFDVSTVKITVVPTGGILSEDGKTLTVPNEGVWSVNIDTGAITFTPEDGFVGDPTPIAYSVEDTQGNETGADIEVDYPPLAKDDNVNAQIGQQLVIYVLENDANTSSPLDVTSVRFIDPISDDEVETVNVLGEGTWNINIDGSVTFTPDDEFTSNPTPIQYIVRELAGDLSNRATITVVYPDAVDDTVTIPTGTTGEIIVNVADNDSNNTLATTVSIGCEEAGVQTLVVDNEGTWRVLDNGDISFTPIAGFIAEPTDIFYTIGLVSDERSNCAKVDIRRELLTIDDQSTLNVGSVTLINILTNDFGALNAQSVQLVLPNNPVLGSVLSEDSRTLTVPGEGVWVVNDLGIVSFTADDELTGSPTPIRYIVENNNGLVSNTATITLLEGGVSVVANDDVGTANGADPVIIDVLENDTGDLNRSSVRILTANGEEVETLVVSGEGTWRVEDDGRIVFTGEVGFVGVPTPIRYIVNNNAFIVLSDTATVTINGTCDCRPYETSIPAMGQLAALSMLMLTILISMFLFKEEDILVKKCYNKLKI